MAISVKNIGPTKLTSLLDWFSKNADEIYKNGTPGAKNVLDKALSHDPRFGIYTQNGLSGILEDALRNDIVNSKYSPMDVDAAIDLNDALVRASIRSKTNYITPPKLTYGLGDVIGKVDYYKNPETLTHYPTGLFTKILQRPLDLNYTNLVNTPDGKALANLVNIPDGTLTTFKRIRPHNNTALGRWYRGKLPQGFNKPNFKIDVQDLPW